MTYRRRSLGRIRLFATFLQLAVPAAILCIAGGEVASAQGAARQLSIPAGSLTGALNRLAAQTGLQILFPAELANGRSTGGLSGSYTPSEALARLLAGTGLIYDIGGNVVTISDRFAAAAPAEADGSLLLDTITIAGGAERNADTGSGYQDTPDWVYETPASVSVISREAIQNNASRNARDLLDNVAGVYANRSEAQNPGISVNIRGLQDQDRIATMIDGARQSFQRNAHGSSQRTYVDTAFIREVDIKKSTTSGVGSVGSLGGSVNFRTLIADDLIDPDQRWGAEINATTGSNAFNFNGSAAAAFRISDHLSILGGVSYKNIGAYDVGKNGDLDLGTTYTEDVLLFSGQEVFSSILKVEADLTDDAKLTMGWVRNDSDFSTGNYDTIFTDGDLQETTEKVVNNTLTAAFDWDPDSELIDLSARLYYNHLKNNSTDGDFIIATGPSNYRMATLGGSLENTSRFDLAFGTVSLNYGAEAFRDDGKSVLDAAYFIDGVDVSDTLSGATPSGRRDLASGFFNATLEHDDWLTVSGGLRYDWYRIAGNTTIYGGETQDIIDYIVTPATPPSCWPSPPFPPNFNCTPGTPEIVTPVYGPYYNPAYDIEIDKSGGAWLPTMMVAVKPYDWLQPFVRYSKSYRPPTIMESFLNGGHGSVNGYAPNPRLEPERADTYELGANMSRDGVFAADDRFRLKAVAFYRAIEDYISLGYIYNSEAEQQYDSYVNLDGITRMKGIEIEANYDAGPFYIGGSFTYIDTDFADSYTTPAGNSMPINSGKGAAVIFEPPNLRVAIDAGLRFLDERLTLGGRVTHVGPTEPTLGSLQDNYKVGDYTLFDVYGSYAFNDTTTLRFGVTNLTDVAYAPALGASFYAMPGRTATVSLDLKF